jgi:hypothetical protein
MTDWAIMGIASALAMVLGPIVAWWRLGKKSAWTKQGSLAAFRAASGGPVTGDNSMYSGYVGGCDNHGGGDCGGGHGSGH